ncbi:MAG: hypothetical protein JWN90_504 [Parcubacteria group bacterium]|nr:hypothetical protein [Parcubacteria group bacterium]
MLNRRLNPYAAIITITAISICATIFVLHKIAKTDFIEAQYAAAAAEY